MTEVIINDRFKVEIDKFNHTLMEWHESNLITSGKSMGKMSTAKWLIVAYLPNMKSVVKYLSTYYILDEATISMFEYADKVFDKTEELIGGIK